MTNKGWQVNVVSNLKVGTRVTVWYAAVVETCCHCRHKEVRYLPLDGYIENIDRIYLDTGNRHKHRIMRIECFPPLPENARYV